MSRYFLRKLEIEGFRGINNKGNPFTLEFNPATINSIFGRNGAGKSSTFEALAYAITGEVPRLANMQKRVENPTNYYVNRFHQGVAFIELTFAADDTDEQVIITVTRDQNGKRKVTGLVKNPRSIDPDSFDPEDFLREINCETLFLDYNTFNNFVMSKPIDRGREFSKLLGLSKINIIKSALEALSDTRNLNTDLNLKDLDNRISQLHQKKLDEIENVLQFLGKITSHDLNQSTFDTNLVEELCLKVLSENPIIRPHIEGKKLEEIDFDECRKKVDEVEGGQKRRELDNLNHLLSELNKPINQNELQKEVDSLIEEIHNRDRLVETYKKKAFKSLYEAAEKVIKDGWPLDICPLCEREWEHHSGMDLNELISSKLQEFKELIDIESKIKCRWNGLIEKALSITVINPLKEAGVLQNTPPILLELKKETVPTEIHARDLLKVMEEIENKRIDAIKIVETKIKELSDKLPPSIVETVSFLMFAEKVSGSLQAYKKVARQLNEIQRQRTAIEKWQEFIGNIASEYSRAESRLVKDTTDLLEQDIRQIFSAIMPGSNILPKLERDQNHQRLHLRLEEFFGLNNVDAVPLLSESYRNALGLAIFLAASKRRNYGGRFLVLDDVTSSFDAGNQYFLMDAIYNFVARTKESDDGLQVIILSHDGILKKYFDQAYSEGKKWNNIELYGDPPRNFVYSKQIKSERIIDNIKRNLERGEIDNALMWTRQYLESSLIKIVRKLGIRVPIDLSTREDKRMIQNLIDAIKYEINIHKRLGDLILTPDQVKQIEETVILIPKLVGNLASHYETSSASSFAPHTVKGAIEKIIEFEQAFKYTCKCGEKKQSKFYKSLCKKQKGCGKNCV